jgi:predicted SprT family Zn-dependent metalloprotease
VAHGTYLSISACANGAITHGQPRIVSHYRYWSGVSAMKINLPESGSVARVWSTYTLANALLAEHGLTDVARPWTIKLSNSHRNAGVCWHSQHVIELSAPLASIWTEDNSRDTILHEIAHALTNDGHGAEWRAVCRKIGARPSRCWGRYGEAAVPEKYKGTCPKGHVIYRARKTRSMGRMSCGTCSRRFNPKYLFVWTMTR